MATVTIDITNQTGYQLRVQSASTTGSWDTVPQGYIELGESASFQALGGDSLQGRISFTPYRSAGSYEVRFEITDNDIRTATRVPATHTQEVATTGAWPDFGLTVVFK